MTQRWKNKPPGSNWGEFGPDDQRGRMNLVTREKVLQGIAEVKEGITFCLLAAARLSRRPGAQSAPRPAAPRRDLARWQAVLLPAPGRVQREHDRRDLRRPGADVAAVLHAMGFVRARRQPFRRRRRRQGRAGVLQRLSRRSGCDARCRQEIRSLGSIRGHRGQGARHPGARRARRAGTRRPHRSAPSLPETAQSHRLRRSDARAGKRQGAGGEGRHGVPLYRLRATCCWR